jgi:histidinol dehydrogenase
MPKRVWSPLKVGLVRTFHGERCGLGFRAVRTIRCTEKTAEATLAELTAESSLFDTTIEHRTRSIVDAVRARGDEALLELTAQFDGARLEVSRLAVSKAELMAASLQADEQTRQAVGVARRNIERFSRRGLRKGWSLQNREGGRVGEKFDPFRRVGVYIPGGTAPLVSTALMTVTLARVAGCPEIVVCTPCARDGSVHPGLLYAARAAGATEIYRVGGAQAIAAMAWGTATVRPVQKIFGPGNAYVVIAKRLLFGRVAIDLLPGPSEVLVLADDSARPEYVAADLLAQAEHGSGHERVWLVTASSSLLTQVRREVNRQLKQRQRADHIRRALENHGCLILVEDLDQAVMVANRLAPEHCEIMTRRAERTAERVVTAGAIFLGSWSPTVLGDYLAGPSHTLPTGGAGASFAGLTVDQFQRRTSVVRYDRTALRKSLATVDAFAGLEGLEAHGYSASIRFTKRKR